MGNCLFVLNHQKLNKVMLTLYDNNVIFTINNKAKIKSIKSIKSKYLSSVAGGSIPISDTTTNSTHHLDAFSVENKNKNLMNNSMNNLTIIGNDDNNDNNNNTLISHSNNKKTINNNNNNNNNTHYKHNINPSNFGIKIALERTSTWKYNRLNLKKYKYFLYQPTGGYNNQRIELNRAIRCARDLKRGLIVPMVGSHALGWEGYSRLVEHELYEHDKITDFHYIQYTLMYNCGTLF